MCIIFYRPRTIYNASKVVHLVDSLYIFQLSLLFLNMIGIFAPATNLHIISHLVTQQIKPFNDLWDQDQSIRAFFVWNCLFKCVPNLK